MSPPAPFAVGIAGGSGSGKSSLVRALTGALGPTRVASLCYDAYYRDRGVLAEIDGQQEIRLVTMSTLEALGLGELMVGGVAVPLETKRIGQATS